MLQHTKIRKSPGIGSAGACLMENSHFIELMIIPLLIIGALLYTDNFDNVSITGNAVKIEQNPNPVLGTYSINPSFKTSFNYDIKNKFSEIKSTMNSVIELCKDNPNTEACLNERISALGWECSQNDEENILHDFTDKIKDCILTDEKSVCKFNFDDKEGINDKNIIREFEIKLISENARTKAQLFERGKLLATDYINVEELQYADYEGRETGKAADTIELTLTYSIGKPSIKEFVATNSNSRIALSKIMLLYNSNGIKFVQTDEENNFRGPLNKEVSLPRYKGIKLCVDAGKKVYAYDASDNSVKMRDLVYHFAITFTTPPPGPLNGVRSVHMPSGEQVILWDKADAASYSIYYSKFDFVDTKLSEIRSDKDILHVSVDAKQPYEEFSTFAGMKFEKGKLYYHTQLNELAYVIETEPNTQYYAAVAAANEQGSEIFNDHSVPNSFVYEKGKNYVEFTSGTDST